jgi:hypothetical protein
MQAPAVRIRRRCDTSTKFDYNRFHLTPIGCTAATLDADDGGGEQAQGNGVAVPSRCAAPGNFPKAWRTANSLPKLSHADKS